MTVMVAGQPIEVYRRFYGEVGKPMIDRSFTVGELALFLYDEPMGIDFLSCGLLPIGQK